MAKGLFLILFLFSSKLWAFSINPLGQHFSTRQIELYISNQGCANGILSTAQVISYSKEAIERFWNKTKSTRPKFVYKGIKKINFHNLTPVQIATQIPVNSVVVGCNENTFNLDSKENLVVGSLLCVAQNCKGVVIFNGNPNSLVPSAPRPQIVTSLAHELGHALGLGHSSDEDALMYFQTSARSLETLGSDDRAALSQLYP